MQKTYPSRCADCGKRSVSPATISHTCEVKHDGRLHTVSVPELSVLKCADCGHVLYSNDADEQIEAALWGELGLAGSAI
jgi:uncharacterized OB-fold protein